MNSWAVALSLQSGAFTEQVLGQHLLTIARRFSHWGLGGSLGPISCVPSSSLCGVAPPSLEVPHCDSEVMALVSHIRTSLFHQLATDDCTEVGPWLRKHHSSRNNPPLLLLASGDSGQL